MNFPTLKASPQRLKKRKTILLLSKYETRMRCTPQAIQGKDCGKKEIALYGQILPPT